MLYNYYNKLMNNYQSVTVWSFSKSKKFIIVFITQIRND